MDICYLKAVEIPSYMWIFLTHSGLIKDWFAPVSIKNFKGGFKIWIKENCVCICKFNSIFVYLTWRLRKNTDFENDYKNWRALFGIDRRFRFFGSFIIRIPRIFSVHI